MPGWGRAASRRRQRGQAASGLRGVLSALELPAASAESSGVTAPQKAQSGTGGLVAAGADSGARADRADPPRPPPTLPPLLCLAGARQSSTGPAEARGGVAHYVRATRSRSAAEDGRVVVPGGMGSSGELRAQSAAEGGAWYAQSAERRADAPLCAG